jgi:transposase InsO family protein
MVDVYSRKCFAVGIKSKQAAEVARELRRLLSRESASYISFQQTTVGSLFVGEEVKQLASNTGIMTIQGRPYHPQSQGIVERLNGVLVKALEIYMNENSSEDWSEKLNDIVWDYNVTPHSYLGDLSPAYVHNPTTGSVEEENDTEKRKEIHQNLMEDVYQYQRNQHQKKTKKTD